MPAEDIFPFLLGAILFMIPIVAILTQHQQKMAKILRENAANDRSHETESLRREVEALRQLVLQQTIAIDNLAASKQLATPPAAPFEERLRQG